MNGLIHSFIHFWALNAPAEAAPAVLGCWKEFPVPPFLCTTENNPAHPMDFFFLAGQCQSFSQLVHGGGKSSSQRVNYLSGVLYC